MKPFVSDHPLFHPRADLIALLSQRDLGDAARRISGFSLKYLRSGLNTYVILPEADGFDSLASRFASAFSRPGEYVHRTPSALRATLQDDAETDTRTQILLQDPATPPDLVISTDGLFYNPEEDRWEGNERSESDYLRGVLRLESPATLDAAAAVRLCTLSAMLDFFPSHDTIAAIQAAAAPDALAGLSRGFLRSQLQNIVTGARPSQGFLALDRSGLLEWFMPELARGRGLAQNRHHQFDIFHHCIYSCDSAERNELHLRLAGLLHDVGKVPTRREGGSGEATFHNHEVIGAKIAGQILFRFGFSRDVIEKVKFLVRNHMFHYTNEWTDRAVRRFLARVSLRDLTDLIDLRVADRRGSGKTTALPPQIRKMLYHIEKIRQDEAELKIKDLAVGGDDLKALGIPPGPEYGLALKKLLDSVKRGELANERDTLLAALQEAVREIRSAATQAPGSEAAAPQEEEAAPVAVTRAVVGPLPPDA